MSWSSVILLLALVAGQALPPAAPAPAPSAAAAQAASELPPPFPRPGTTNLIDNSSVAVWDVSWLKQKYPLHHHRYDLVGISYVEGDRIVTTNGVGRLQNTKPWVFQTNFANVTHVEEGASDTPMRAILIEVKSPAPRPAAAAPADGLRQVLGTPAWDTNPRVTAWLIMPGSPVPMHRHVGDAVELTFEGSGPTPKATFVAAGTVHAGPTPPADGRAYIFELK